MQTHRQKIGGRKLVVFALVAVFVLGSGWNSRASSEVINIGWTGEYLSTLPIRVAVDKGIFERDEPILLCCFFRHFPSGP